MDAEILTQWVNALESGKYQQTPGVLRRKDTDGNIGYCCLGVLKEITGSTWVEAVHKRDGGKFQFIAWDDEEEEGTSTVYVPHDYDDQEAKTLPDTCFTYPSDDDLEKWGLSWINASELAEMNDEGESFSSIADYIRAVLVQHEQAETA